MADLSVWYFTHTSLCSLSCEPSLRLVSQMYTLPQVHSTLYVTLNCLPIRRWSFTLWGGYGGWVWTWTTPWCWSPPDTPSPSSHWCLLHMEETCTLPSQVAYKSRVPSPIASSHLEEDWSIQLKHRQEKFHYQVVYKRTFSSFHVCRSSAGATEKPTSIQFSGHYLDHELLER